MGLDLRLHLMIHKMLNRLSDKGKDMFFSVFKDAHEGLEKAGDMDYARKTINSLLKDPQFVWKAAMSLPWLLADII